MEAHLFTALWVWEGKQNPTKLAHNASQPYSKGCSVWCTGAPHIPVKKGPVLAIALLTWLRLVTWSALQPRMWQLIGMSLWYRSALCGHPLPASANNWTRSLQLADIPPPQSATLGLHPIDCKLLLISHPAGGRRVSWPEGHWAICDT